VLHGSQFFAVDGSACNEDYRHGMFEITLVKTKSFAQQPPCSGADYRVSQPAGGDDTQLNLGIGRQWQPICNQASFRQPTAFFANSSKFAFGVQAHRAGQTLSATPVARHGCASHSIRVSVACDPRADGSPEWPVRFLSNCGSKSRAAVSGLFSRVDIAVSFVNCYLFQVFFMWLDHLTRETKACTGTPVFTELGSLSMKLDVSSVRPDTLFP